MTFTVDLWTIERSGWAHFTCDYRLTVTQTIILQWWYEVYDNNTIHLRLNLEFVGLIEVHSKGKLTNIYSEYLINGKHCYAPAVELLLENEINLFWFKLQCVIAANNCGKQVEVGDDTFRDAVSGWHCQEKDTSVLY